MVDLKYVDVTFKKKGDLGNVFEKGFIKVWNSVPAKRAKYKVRRMELMVAK